MMRSGHFLGVLVAAGWLWLAVSDGSAQQVTVGTPMRSASDSFFEHIGTNWGFDHRGLSVRFGSPNIAAPQFGGFDPNAGIRGGVTSQGNGFNGFLNFSAGQGFRQNLVSQTPSVTLTNGYPGSISDTSISPFVIGYVPVVGGFPVVPYPYAMSSYPGTPMINPGSMAPLAAPNNNRLQAMREQLANQKLPADNRARPRPAPAPPVVVSDPGARKLASSQASSAGRAAPSVAEARRLHQLEQAAQNEEATVLFERGRTAEEGGKANVAKTYYKMAAKRAAGKLQRQIQARLDALDHPDGP